MGGRRRRLVASPAVTRKVSEYFAATARRYPGARRAAGVDRLSVPRED